jgi:hypothetical protein
MKKEEIPLGRRGEWVFDRRVPSRVGIRRGVIEEDFKKA